MNAMTPQTTDRTAPEPRAGSSARQRRVDALIAAYIHELSDRHRAEREAGRAEPGEAGQRA
jgi:hypothetical protein